MNDEMRDPELDWMRARWRALEPSEAVDERLMAEYRRRTGMSRMRRIWWPMAAAALVASAALVMSSLRPEEMSYRPVAQPRMIDVSQGERP